MGGETGKSHSINSVDLGGPLWINIVVWIFLSMLIDRWESRWQSRCQQGQHLGCGLRQGYWMPTGPSCSKSPPRISEARGGRRAAILEIWSMPAERSHFSYEEPSTEEGAASHSRLAKAQSTPVPTCPEDSATPQGTPTLMLWHLT